MAWYVVTCETLDDNDESNKQWDPNSEQMVAAPLIERVRCCSCFKLGMVSSENMLDCGDDENTEYKHLKKGKSYCSGEETTTCYWCCYPYKTKCDVYTVPVDGFSGSNCWEEYDEEKCNQP